MKTRYKITIIAFSALVGIMFIPMIASNLYCDYLADFCTSKITGVGPGGVYLPAEWGTREGCFVASDDGTAERCRIDIAQINWPFPPRMHELGHDCMETCPDDETPPEESDTSANIGKISEEDIPIFFEIQLNMLGIDWERSDRVWKNYDFEIKPPARVCSHVISDGGNGLYISTIWQDEYSLSDIAIQPDMPNDCVKFLPVTELLLK